jgi:uncharacterized protein YegP (UPF0339 family)
MGKFVITKRANGENQFNLKAGNGQRVLSGEGSSENDIESVKKNALVGNVVNETEYGQSR